MKAPARIVIKISIVGDYTFIAFSKSSKAREWLGSSMMPMWP